MHYTYPSKKAPRRIWAPSSIVNSFTEKAMMYSHIHLGHWAKAANMAFWGLIKGARGGIVYIDLYKARILLRAFWGFYVHILRKNATFWVANGDDMYAPQMRTRMSPILVVNDHTIIHDRWHPGLLTNFKKKRDHWTTIYSCLKRVPEVLPTSIFLFRNKDMAANWLGFECFRLRLPWSMVADSNISPYGVTYPLAGNNDTFCAFEFYSSLLRGVFSAVLYFRLRRAARRLFVDRAIFKRFKRFGWFPKKTFGKHFYFFALGRPLRRFKAYIDFTLRKHRFSRRRGLFWKRRLRS